MPKAKEENHSTPGNIVKFMLETKKDCSKVVENTSAKKCRKSSKFATAQLMIELDSRRNALTSPAKRVDEEGHVFSVYNP